MSLATVIAILVIVSAFGICLMPIVSGSGATAAASSETEETREDLEAERHRIVSALRDVDMDLAMGKVSLEDHASMKRSLEDRGMEVLADLDAGSASGGEAPRGPGAAA